MGNLVKFVSKDGLEKLEPWVSCDVAVRLCSDGGERTYRLTRVDGKYHDLPVYVEVSESKPLEKRLANRRLVDAEEAQSAFEPVQRHRDELIAELAKEREQARAGREQTISYADQKVADWKGIADTLRAKVTDMHNQLNWLERELKLEKAKNARKRGL